MFICGLSWEDKLIQWAYIIGCVLVIKCTPSLFLVAAKLASGPFGSGYSGIQPLSTESEHKNDAAVALAVVAADLDARSSQPFAESSVGGPPTRSCMWGVGKGADAIVFR